MKDVLTIIIPTRNRPNNLGRLLKYYDGRTSRFELIIADSSSGNHFLQNKNSCERSNLQTTHTEYSEEIPLVDKINSSLKEVQTPYVAICADDDFISLVGLQSAIKFLIKNKSFSAAHGNYISYCAKKTKSGVTFDWSPSYTDSRTISQSKPKNRLHAHHSDYTPTFYAVHRTSSIREGFESAVTATDDVRFGELLPSMTAVINGKFKHLNVFYGARYNAQQTGSTADNLTDFIQAGSFTSKYHRYRNSLANRLEAQSDLTHEKSLTIVDDAMISYLVNSYRLPQEEATDLVKQGRVAKKIANTSSSGSAESASFPAKIRDWLQTTPVPERAVSILQNIYIGITPPMKFLISGDVKRANFYLRLDKLIIGDGELIRQIRQSVQSHPEALDE